MQCAYTEEKSIHSINNSDHIAPASPAISFQCNFNGLLLKTFEDFKLLRFKIGLDVRLHFFQVSVMSLLHFLPSLHDAHSYSLY